VPRIRRNQTERVEVLVLEQQQLVLMVLTIRAKEVGLPQDKNSVAHKQAPFPKAASGKPPAKLVVGP
jgi:hypothetical protein